MTQTTSNHDRNDGGKIENREELIAALNKVAEVEHQFMCMYLYAAFSLKKNPDKDCNAAQFEAVRRWTSKIYMIARQEMEHLSLVNSMLAAIGAPPYFSRPNIPKCDEKKVKKVSPENLSEPLNNVSVSVVEIGATFETTTRYHEEQLKPCEFPFIFEPFDLKSAKRYVCMESPKRYHLSKEQQKDVTKWCFPDEEGNCNHCLPENDENIKKEVGVATIEMLYQSLREGFETVAKKDKSLFVGYRNQHQVEVQSQYDVYIFPVTDLTSALNAIDLIVKQGEGLINAPPDFNSHFHSFYDIAKEYEKLTGGDDKNKFAILPVPSNPKQENIKNEFTKTIFDLLNYCYVTLLYVLTGLYGWYKPASDETNYPHISAALREIAFAPTMTMLVRSLGEVLVQLPLDREPNKVAAPNFHVSIEDKHQLIIDAEKKEWQSDKNYYFYTDIEFYLKRFEKILKDIKPFAHEIDTHCKFLDEKAREDIKKQLEYIYQNVYRMTGNLRKVYQTGVYRKFKVFS